MNKQSEELLTIGEIADILRVSTRSVHRYIESGKLKASNIGVWRIRRSDLEDFLRETSNADKRTK